MESLILYVTSMSPGDWLSHACPLFAQQPKKYPCTAIKYIAPGFGNTSFWTLGALALCVLVWCYTPTVDHSAAHTTCVKLGCKPTLLPRKLWPQHGCPTCKYHLWYAFSLFQFCTQCFSENLCSFSPILLHAWRRRYHFSGNEDITSTTSIHANMSFRHDEPHHNVTHSDFFYGSKHALWTS